MAHWTKKWLQEQRRKGTKCLEIKELSNNYYVYKSTTYWDKEAKKRKKSSVYIGTLDREKGLIKRKEKTVFKGVIKQYGTAAMLNLVMEDIIPPLKDGFDEIWEEIYAMALVRIMGYVPLKRVGSVWERLYNIKGLTPNLSPKHLSSILKEVGQDRLGQNIIFKKFAQNGTQMVYDLSTIFTRSEGMNFNEKGYNKDWIHLPQINLALFSSLKTGMPIMIRALPGSIKDISSLYYSIQEIGVEGKIVVLDRGFFSEDVIEFLTGKHLSFLVPAKRNSDYYKERIHLSSHFFYRERLIKCGRKKLDDFYLYLFEDTQMKAEEEKGLYKKLDKKKITQESFVKSKKRAGRILLLSDWDIKKEEVFLMYKQRDSIEKLFDTYKTVLNADKLYLHDDVSVFGHIFISFLSLYGYCKLVQYLRKADLLRKKSPLDLIEDFSKVYSVEKGEDLMISEVPKKLRELDEMLTFHVFPK